MLFRDRDDFDDTVLAAAEVLGLPPMAVEKDYWVTEALRALSAHHMTDFVFKGGTSLSKAHKILKRFSEDIDLLVPKGDGSWGAADRLMKEMAQVVTSALSGPCTSQSAETGRHRTYAISYSVRQPEISGLRPEILLEMGVRGGPEPHSNESITPLIRDPLEDSDFQVDDYEDLAEFSVHVLHPARTLLEKLTIVHQIATKVESGEITTIPNRSERHPHDIYELLGDGRVLAFLEDRDNVDRVLSDIERVTVEFFIADGETYIGRPNGGFADSPVFARTSKASELFRSSYEQNMPLLYYGPDLPSWDEVLARVQDAGSLL